MFLFGAQAASQILVNPRQDGRLLVVLHVGGGALAEDAEVVAVQTLAQIYSLADVRLPV